MPSPCSIGDAANDSGEVFFKISRVIVALAHAFVLEQRKMQCFRRLHASKLEGTHSGQRVSKTARRPLHLRNACSGTAHVPAACADEVRGHFQDLTYWLAAVIDKGLKAGSLSLQTDPKSEAMAFMAVVHGAMLATRAYGDNQIFAAIMDPALTHLAPQA
jgi:hypothetical protein